MDKVISYMHVSQPLPQTSLLSQRAYEQNVHDIEMENIHDLNKMNFP